MDCTSLLLNKNVISPQFTVYHYISSRKSEKMKSILSLAVSMGAISSAEIYNAYNEADYNMNVAFWKEAFYDRYKFTNVHFRVIDLPFDMPLQQELVFYKAVVAGKWKSLAN